MSHRHFMTKPNFMKADKEGRVKHMTALRGSDEKMERE